MPKRPLIYDFLMQNKNNPQNKNNQKNKIDWNNSNTINSHNNQNINDKNNSNKFNDNYINNKNPPLKLKSNTITIDNINKLNDDVDIIIKTAHKKHQHPSPVYVINQLCSQYKISNLSQITVDKQELDECGTLIPRMKSHIDIITRINNIIHCYVSTNIISTIPDIEACVLSEFGIKCFGDLEIGVFSRMDLVMRYFNLSANSRTEFRVSAGFVISSLKKFKRGNPKNKRDIFSFLDYLCRLNKCKSLIDLGIKIKDFSVLCEIEENIEAHEQKVLEKESERLKKLLVTDVDDELRKLTSVCDEKTKIVGDYENNRECPSGSEYHRKHPTTAEDIRVLPTSAEDIRTCSTSVENSLTLPKVFESERTFTNTTDNLQQPTASENIRTLPTTFESISIYTKNTGHLRDIPIVTENIRELPKISEDVRILTISTEHTRNIPTGYEYTRTFSINKESDKDYQNNSECRKFPISNEHDRDLPIVSEDIRTYQTNTENNREQTDCSENSRKIFKSYKDERKHPSDFENDQTFTNSFGNNRNKTTNNEQNRNLPTASEDTRIYPTIYEDNREGPNEFKILPDHQIYYGMTRYIPGISETHRKKKIETEENRTFPNDSDNNRKRTNISEDCREQPNITDKNRTLTNFADNTRIPDKISDYKSYTSPNDFKRIKTNIEDERRFTSTNEDSRKIPSSSDYERLLKTASDDFRKTSPTAPIARALKCIPFERFVENYENFIYDIYNNTKSTDISYQHFFENFSSLLYTEQFEYAKKFITLLKRLASESICDSSIVHLSFYYSVVNYLSTNHGLNISSFNTVKNTPPIDISKISLKFKEFIAENPNFSLNDLYIFEAQIFPNQHSVLSLIFSDNELASSLNVESSLKSNQCSLIDPFLKKWAGIVPEKFAQIQLLRNLNIDNLGKINIINFSSYYSNYSLEQNFNYSLQSDKGKIVDLDVFLCGYPLYPINFKNLKTHIRFNQNINDFSDILDPFLFIDNKTGYFFDDVQGYSHILKSFPNSIFLLDSCKKQLCKVRIFEDPEKSIVDAGYNSDYLTVSSVLISQLVQLSNHWETSVYSLLTVWVTKMFKSISSSRLELVRFIIKMISVLEVRLAALILSKVLIPSFLVVFDMGNLYDELFEAAAENKIVSKLMKISIIENIPGLFLYDKYIDQLSVGKENLEIINNKKVIEFTENNKSVKVEFKTENKTSIVINTSYNSLIDQIRREQYLYGVENINPEIDQLLKIQINRLNRTLVHLSSDLYSNKHHFMFELFQNLDDAFVGKNISDPSVAFVITPRELYVLSNEPGFSEQDILAICDIANSSKDGTSQIGYKGIGFKSVFQITDCPEIHSNGFHICFNFKKYGPLGYVMPESIPYDESKFYELKTFLPNNFKYEWNTIFSLPFKESSRVSPSSIFETIGVNQIMFLKNIQNACLINISEQKINIFKREMSNDIISIIHNDTTHNFVYLTETNPENCCEVTIAFPVVDFKESEYIKPQNLYCYLPLDISPFNFIINAPFLVNSSRENIIDGDEWNLNILNNISHIFVSSINLLKTHSDLYNVPWLYVLSSFIPNHKHYNAPFDWVAKSIMKSITQTKFIEINSNFYDPSSCVFIPSFFIEYFTDASKNFIIDKDTFTSIMNLQIIQISNIVSENSLERIFSLGICEFNLEIFLNFVIKWYHSIEYKEKLLNIHTISIVFGMICNFIKSERYGLKSGLFKQIENLDIIPIGKEFTSLSKEVFFFKKSDCLIQYIDLLQSVINIIDFSVLRTCVEICNNFSVVYKTLSLMAIKCYDHSILFNSFCMQFFKLNHDVDVLVKFYKYAAKISQLFPEVSLESIRKNAYVITQKNEKWNVSSKIYRNTNIIKLFNDQLTTISIPIIHDSFCVDREVIDLLSKICLLDSFKLYEVSKEDVNYKNILLLLRKVNFPNLDIANGEFLDVTNYHFLCILLNGTFDEKYFLSEYLDSQWDNFSVHDLNRSSFLFLLKHHPWLPDASLNKSCKPNSLFNKTDRMRSFLGKNSDYLISFCEFNNEDLVSFLKLRNEILPDDLISIFKHWSSSSFQTSKRHLLSIYSELEILLLVNKSLLATINSCRIPLVFLPEDLSIFNQANETDLISGKLISHHDVFMRDPIFSGAYLKFPTISSIYKDKIYCFFKDILKISDTPCFETYLVMFHSQFIPKISISDNQTEVIRVISMIGCQCLNSITDIESFKNTKFLSIADLYEAILVNINQSRADLLYSSIKNFICIPTDNNKIVCLASFNLYICDDYYTKEAFSKSAQIDYIYIPESVFSQPFITPTIELIGILCICCASQISLLSKSCQVSINVDMDSMQKNDISQRLVESVPFIYGYFKCNYNEFSSRYISTQTWDDMLKIECYSSSSSNIQMSYSLGKNRIRVSTDVGSSHQDGPTIYFYNKDLISRNNDILHTKIFNEFIRLFIKNANPCLIRDISSFVRDIMQVSVDKRPQYLTFFGFDSQNFLNHFNDYLRIYRPSNRRSSITSINFKVTYNNENEGDSSTDSLKPVFQPLLSVSVENEENQADVSFSVPFNNTRNSYTDQIGRWGEAVINQMLHNDKEKLDLGDEIFEIEWVNESSESLLPYDFVLKTRYLFCLHRNIKNIEKLVYLEVKASSKAKNQSFDLSFREIEFAQYCKGNYHILKVTPKNNKSSFEFMKEDECEIKLYKNLIQQLNKKTIRILALPK